ncbi:hypothetical protein EDD15DRAFT_2202512 [Pisolithus albus]|nr:hypothetical protein EDD15DRAFT_2202512 [Pisolithus albus]
MTQLLGQGKGRRSRATCRVTSYLPDGVRNTPDNLTPEGRVAVDSAFFERGLSECEDTKGNQPSIKTLQEAQGVGSTAAREEPRPRKKTKKNIRFQLPVRGRLKATIDNIPHSAVSSDGTSLLHYLHKFLNHQLANEYYKTVTKYCKAAKPSMVSATGTSANGQYIEREGKTAGMLCLARYWHAIGQSKEKTGSRVFEFVDYLRDTELLSHAINRALQVIDAEFHENFSPQGDGEPEVPSRREIIFNQKSGPHVDRQDPQLTLVAPLALGEFSGGYLHCPQLGLDG